MHFIDTFRQINSDSLTPYTIRRSKKALISMTEGKIKLRKWCLIIFILMRSVFRSKHFENVLGKKPVTGRLFQKVKILAKRTWKMHC